MIGISILLLDLGTKELFFRPGSGRLTNELIGVFEVNSEWMSAITASVTGAFAWWAYHVLKSGRNALTVVLVLSGALGNLFDRILFGGVRDWIPLFSFSIINIADIAIGIGIAGLMWCEVIVQKKSPPL